MTQVRIRILVAVWLVLGLCLSSSVSFAQTRSLDDGPAIRRQLLHRSARFELQPGVAAMWGNSYQTPLYGNLAMRYHLSNSVSVGLDLNGSPVAVNRRIMREIEDNDPAVFGVFEVAKTPFIGSFQITYSPFVGKVNLFGKTTTYFDVHLIAGVGAAMRTADSPALKGVAVAPVVGIGLRLFVSDGIAIVGRVVDYIYQDAEAHRIGTSVDEKWRNHVVGTLGVSFFFPRGVYVSK